MKLLFFFFLFNLSLFCFAAPVKNVTQVIESFGYQAEYHTAVTEDGYVLGMQRILPASGLAKARGAVLLQHGLLDSAYTWVANQPSQSLGFLLADADYDVWLGNARGNTYSMQTVDGADPSSEAFWDFSWDEMLRYDFPALVSAVLNATGRATLAYVGHSQGGIMGIGGAAFAPALQRAVRPMVTLAPALYINHCAAPGAQQAGQLPTDDIYTLLGRKGVLESTATLETALGTTCSLDGELCADKICEFAGCDSPMNFNFSALPQLVRHFPAGTSTKDLGHFQQQIALQSFRMYDYGAEGNLQHYGQDTPPLYDLSSIPATYPLAVYYGDNDLLVVPTDIDYLLAQLQSSVNVTVLPSYGHADFVWGLSAADILYPSVIDFIQRFI